VKPYNSVDQTRHIEQHTVLMAFHHGLKQLGLDIVWIEWIANWKNILKLLYVKHSPLHWITISSAVDLRYFPQQKMDNFFQMDYFERKKTLPSIKQSISYCAELMFGCKLVKDENDCWILDNPLTPTHELDLGLKARHRRYHFAKKIREFNYDVMKSGRFWEVKDQEELLDDFLEGKMAWGYNTQYLVLLDSAKFLVEYDPDIHHPVLPCQKIQEYKIEVELDPPIWKKTREPHDTYFIDNHTFLHVGPKRSEVQKRIWYTRDVWKQKLKYMADAILSQHFKGETDQQLIDTLQMHGYDVEYSTDIEYDLKTIFDLIRSFSEWIDHCSHQTCLKQKVQDADGNRFTSRLARIVYQVFNVDTIWREVEKQLLTEGESFVESIPSHHYETARYETAQYDGLQDKASLSKDSCEYFKKIFNDLQPGPEKSEKNSRNLIVIKNVMIRRWLYDIENIRAHPLKYKLKQIKLSEKQVTILRGLRAMMQQWISEQIFYGGDKSSFTYIWT
jgi:hypothetical protein